MDEKDVIAVIGWTGMVGSTVYNYYKKKGYEVMGYSRSNQTHTMNEINDRAEYIFVCVPTPYDWKKQTYDISVLEATLNNIRGRKKVIIKSTVVPGTTASLQDKFPSLQLYFNPEFLSEATAETDFINPDRQIVGYTKRSYYNCMEIINLLPQSPYDVVMTSTEAEIVKYVNNFHGALMVMFSNLMYDICEKTSSDFTKVKKASLASKWVGSPMGRMYWDVTHGGYRGYGGKCFPKDINSLIKWCETNGIEAEILKATHEANVRILAKQKLTEQEVEVKSSRQT